MRLAWRKCSSFCEYLLCSNDVFYQYIYLQNVIPLTPLFFGFILVASLNALWNKPELQAWTLAYRPCMFGLKDCARGSHITRCASVTVRAVKPFLFEAMREAICIHIGQGGVAGCMRTW